MPTPLRRRSWPLLAVVLCLLASACGADDPDDVAPPIVADEPTAAPADDAAPGSIFGADPLLDEQWGLAATGVPDAWAVAGGDGVTIAIVDSGVDLDHPDLIDNLVPGWDFVDGDDRPDDPNGHGTHVAGIAAASSNELGIAGAAPNASIMPIRVLDEQGNGNDEVIAEAVRWAADNGADVINLSLGEAGFISRFTKGGALNRAIRDVTAQGVIVVAASGNEGAAGQQYRIGVDVLIVNATDQSGELASFSNVGDVRAISAPGVAIMSTAPVEPTDIWPDGTDGYAPLDGTSMATPLVSGIAALALSAGVPADDVVDVLVDTAANPDGLIGLGAGIVDAAASLGVTDAPVETSTTTTAPPTTTEPPSTTTTPPPSTTLSPDEIVAELRARLDSIDTAVPATCAVDGNRLTVSFDISSDDVVDQAAETISVAAELVIRGFVGAGSYPATGSVTIVVPGQEPIVVPLLGEATVDDAGAGSISVTVEGVEVSVAWTC